MDGFEEIAKQLPWARGVRVLRCDANGLLAIEKPAGTLSHPNKKGDQEGALLRAAYHSRKQAYSILDAKCGEERLVYLLNRLDSATSGVVMLALQKATAQAVLRVFEEKRVQKTYHALVFGAPRAHPPIWRDRLSVRRVEGGLRAQAGAGLSAETRLLKVEALPGMPAMSRLTLAPITGRTHQLRIQSAQRHAPIVGDRTYGDFQKNKLVAKRGIKRLCLHCVGTELEYRLEGRKIQFQATSPCPF